MIKGKLEAMKKYSITSQFALKSFLSHYGARWDTMQTKDMMGAINLSPGSAISRTHFEGWQELMVNTILSYFDISFEDLAPQNMLRIYDILLKYEEYELKIAGSRMRDIIFHEPIGTLENVGWEYTDSDDYKEKIKALMDIKNERFTFFDLLLLAYWSKKGGLHG